MVYTNQYVISILRFGGETERLPVWVVGVLQRIFGLLLGALAIEFVIQGLKQAFAI